MQIEMMAIGDITPYKNNPRKNEKAVEAVKASIAEFGFKVPIVVDKDGVIVTGHTRYIASIELGLTEVPCIVARDLSPAQVKAFRLADNKTAEMAEWDYDLLGSEIAELGDEFDLSDFGFTNEVSIDWDDIPSLTEEEYHEPKHQMRKCPKCGHIDRADRFTVAE